MDHDVLNRMNLSQSMVDKQTINDPSKFMMVKSIVGSHQADKPVAMHIKTPSSQILADPVPSIITNPNNLNDSEDGK
jgi:hypothetical protein